MRDELFNELLESVREGGAILRGEKGASRTFKVAKPRKHVAAKRARARAAESGAVDVGAIREGLGLSRPKFAALLGISPRTVEGWEQGRREPEGPAKVLLQVAAMHPEVVLETVAGKRKP